ncbi:hypothetical protein [Amphritea balenae]|uniref:Uncharacterized protein n=1 Tax=Amphritea balenae TaxID=452629 RepID=A0A3P1SYY8_9GAMM|nr:hypothetical protein [Amphritea balenae]RRD01766.1 hypothetical protein EHS89_04265 [Amphritea balenae]
MLLKFTAIVVLSMASSLSVAQPVKQGEPKMDGTNSLVIQQDEITNFRQISLRILAAYKHQPHYVGSTAQWHLFLRKQVSTSESRSFTAVFGYKIPKDKAIIENGWDLVLPSNAIDPEDCPTAKEYLKDKTGFILAEGLMTKSACVDR